MGRFPQLRVRPADHRNLKHARYFEQYVFDLSYTDPEPARLDELAGSAGHIDKTIFIHRAQVARVQSVSAKRILGRIWSQIAQGNILAFSHDLTRLPRSHRIPRIV